MNCLICGRRVVDNLCNNCGYEMQKVGNFKRLFSRTKQSNIFIDKINDFFKFYQSLKNLNSYKNRKYYQGTLNSYFEDYQAVKTLEETNMLDSFSKKHNYPIRNLNNFLTLYKNYYGEVDKLNKEYVERRLIEEKEYFDHLLKVLGDNVVPDDDQRRAILTDEDYNLIIAGAGAGKTTTMAAKVKYLIDKEGIEEDEILVISFTRMAVAELKEKIHALGIKPVISTFHSIGYSILAKEGTDISRVLYNKFWPINNYLTNVLLDDLETLKKLILFFGFYLNIPSELFEFNDLEQYYLYLTRLDYSTLKSNLGDYNQDAINIRSRKKITINNEFLKSYEEVRIANFLYLHNIDYTYEKPYKYKMRGMNRRYTPDFCINYNGREIYIEHFGITENGKNNRYSDVELRKYIKSMHDKKNFHREKGTTLISTYSAYNDGRDLIVHLQEELEKHGVELIRRKDEEVFKKILKLEREKYFYSFSRLTESFIGLFKINGYTEKDFNTLKSRTTNPRTLLFLDLMEQVYLYYQNYLKKNNAVDFEDMINESTRMLKSNEKIRFPFKYIIVDEYQDISRQRYNLAYELAKITDAKVVAVGDDWQSIFAFAGSDVSLFTQFCKTFGYGKELQIRSTYRNAQELIDIAGGFIQKNTAQIKKQLISKTHINAPVIVYTYDNTGRNTKKLEAKAYNVINVIKNIIVKGNITDVSKHEILILGRYNFDAANLGRTKYFTYDKDSSKLTANDYPDLNLTFLTVHSAKGLGYDDVIIINADNAIYGFPSQIEDDPILKLVTTEDRELEFAEERRLFYVALTRTKNRVFIIAPKTNPSRFVVELVNDYEDVVLQGKFDENYSDPKKSRPICPVCGYPVQLRNDPNFGMKIYVCMNEPELCGFVTNNMNGDKRGIHFCDKCDGYMIVRFSRKNNNYFYGCTNYIDKGKGCQETARI